VTNIKIMDLKDVLAHISIPWYLLEDLCHLGYVAVSRKDSSEASGTTHTVAHHHIPENLNLQQHNNENFLSHMFPVGLLMVQKITVKKFQYCKKLRSPKVTTLHVYCFPRSRGDLA